MTADRVRVAVVGTGHWARVAHLPGWLRDPRAEVVALADVNEAALTAAAREFGIERVTADYRELLDDRGIDVIDVATGNRPHFQISWERCPPESTCCARSRCTPTTGGRLRRPAWRPASALLPEPDGAGHTGLTEAALQRFTAMELEVQ
jgi:hypothetical protein